MQKIASINPATEEVYGAIEETTHNELVSVISAARNNKAWAEKHPDERAVIVSKFCLLLKKYKEGLARIMAEETGKPVKAGRREIDTATKRIEAFCTQIPSWLADEVAAENKQEKNVITYPPLGVVAVISPWNAPVFVSLANIIPPLLCGNNVVYKPSEYATFTGIKLGKLFEELRKHGLPENAFQIVVGGKEAGKRLVQSNIDMAAFTGSISAGRDIAKHCGEKLKKCILELGGKDAAIIMQDADITKTAKEIVKSSTMYTGQVCFGVERVYCHERRFQAFVQACVEETKKLIVGNPVEETTDIGPFSVKFQMEKVLEHIRDAIDKGAQLVHGGQKLGEKGYFMSPGVMINVNHSMKIMQEETFGPITPIMPFEDVREAVKMANDSCYGLTASVWTRDIKDGENIARQLEAGTVGVNRHGMSKAGLPWGGWKDSGLGRIYSKEGVREFTNIRHVWVAKV